MSRHQIYLLSALAGLILLTVFLRPLDNSRESGIGDSFNISTEGIVEVILRDYNDGTLHYDCVGPNQTRRETDTFQSDPVHIYRAEPEYFSPENEILQVRLTDEHGDEVEITPDIENIFHFASGIDHAVHDLYILDHKDACLVVVELNVNMWWPCRLYHYDPATTQFTQLYTYDATEIIGLRIRNPQNLPA